MPIEVRDMIRRLEADGWVLRRQTGQPVPEPATSADAVILSVPAA